MMSGTTETILGIVLMLIALLGTVGIAVKVLYPCGDALDHDNRRRNGKGNDCGCPLA
jgi:hypothetical protein